MPVAPVIAAVATAASTAASIKAQAAAKKGVRGVAVAGAEPKTAQQTAAEERFAAMQFTLDQERFNLEQERVRNENQSVDQADTRKNFWAYGGLTLLAISVLLFAYKSAKKNRII